MVLYREDADSKQGGGLQFISELLNVLISTDDLTRPFAGALVSRKEKIRKLGLSACQPCRANVSQGSLPCATCQACCTCSTNKS